LSQYYFTVASLPNLSYETEPSVSYEDFMDLCQNTLEDAEYSILSSVHLDGLLPDGITNKVLQNWSLFEQSLRNELAKLRGPDLGIDYEKYTKEFLYKIGTQAIARNAIKEENPLKAEEYLNRERWIFLEELEVGHFFDLEKLIVYSIRLQLLERKKFFSMEKGKEHFQEMYEKIKTAIAIRDA